MVSNLPVPLYLVATLLTTYFVHSTLLLGSVWLLVRVFRVTSPALRERLWKGAAVAGLLTAPLQLVVNGSDQHDTVVQSPRSKVQDREAVERGETRAESQQTELAAGSDPSSPSSIFYPPSSSLHLPSSVLAEHHALQQELQSLDEEIHSLDETLRATGATDEMIPLLDRLRARLDALRGRREVLHILESLDPNSLESPLPPEEK